VVIAWEEIINNKQNKCAVIVAAGQGTRLKPLTDTTPKCLLKVNGIPIIKYQLDNLVSSGINNLAIVTGYKGFMIKNYIDNSQYSSKINVTYIHNEDYKKTGSCYSLYLCKDYLSGRGYIHINSDLIFHKDFLNILINSKEDNCVITDKPLIKNFDMVRFECNEKGRINKVGRPDYLPNPNGYLIGPIKFSNEAKNYFIQKIESRLNEGILDDTCFLLLNGILDKIMLYSKYSNNKKWFEIDTKNDLAFAKANLA
jgi:choline kinase